MEATKQHLLPIRMLTEEVTTHLWARGILLQHACPLQNQRLPLSAAGVLGFQSRSVSARSRDEDSLPTGSSHQKRRGRGRLYTPCFFFQPHQSESHSLSLHGNRQGVEGSPDSLCQWNPFYMEESIKYGKEELPSRCSLLKSTVFFLNICCCLLQGSGF